MTMANTKTRSYWKEWEGELREALKNTRKTIRITKWSKYVSEFLLDHQKYQYFKLSININEIDNFEEFQSFLKKVGAKQKSEEIKFYENKLQIEESDFETKSSQKEEYYLRPEISHLRIEES